MSSPFPSNRVSTVRPDKVLPREKDFRPIAGYPFQRWGERTGTPFCDMRPLTSAAAQRVWRRALELNGAEWDGSLPADRFPRQVALDLRDPVDSWDETSVRDWLSAREADDARPALACYGPEWVVQIPWGTFCDSWLTLLWVEALVWPGEEAWFLRYADDRLTFGEARLEKSDVEFPW